MTNILSSISGYFSKSLILGTFLPVVIFIILGTIFLIPLLPSDLTLLAPLEGIDKQWKVLAVSFVAIVISGLIYNLNIPILRMYEGYPWQSSLIGMWLTRRQYARFDAAQYRIAAMRAVLREMVAVGDKLQEKEQYAREVIENLQALGSRLRRPTFDKQAWLKIWETWEAGAGGASDLKEQWERIKEEFLNDYSAYRVQILRSYPDKRGLILPTRLGNVVRSFEYYSDREYGIDSVEIWPRLVAVIHEDYAVSVDDAKTTFDFMMNCSALSLVLAALILLAGLIYPQHLASLPWLLYWVAKIVAFVLVSYFFYRLSINRAGAWGAMVKGAFDLYRWELLKKLGYKQEPEKREDERKLWDAISRQMIYGDPFSKKLQDYVKESSSTFPAVTSTPAKVKLEMTRGVKTNAADGVVTFYLKVENRDSNLAEANVVVTDKLPDDFDYEWGSAKIGNVEVPVSGTNPYKFSIGHLQKNTHTVLKYNAVPRKKSS